MTTSYIKTVKKIFIQKLEQYAEIVGKQLYERYRFQCTAISKQFPLLMSGLWKDSEKLKPFDKVETVLKNGTLSIGYIGLAECLVALTGKHHGEIEETQNLGLEIIRELEEIAMRFAEKYNLNYNILAVSSPKIQQRFLKKDQKQFGIMEGITDKKQYTDGNSLPKNYEGSFEEKAKIEGPYHQLTKGGNLFYAAIKEEEIQKVETVYQVADVIEKYDIGYANIQIKKIICPRCEYESTDLQLKDCPNCGSGF